MGNIMLKLKRFLGNKNTVTILCVIAGVAVLLIGYNYRVNQAVQPVSVPYALTRMSPKSKVEADDVGTIKVSGAFVEQTEDLITSKSYILNNEWYVHYDTVIPEGGLFYKSQLVTKDELPDTAFDDIDEGATIFSLSVNSHTTYGDSIMPGNFIDLYLKATDDNGKIIFGKFIESIKVLSVRDSSGKDVFSDNQANSSSSELLFAVQDDLFILLSEASFVGGIEIVPVPRNEAYRNEGDTENGTQVSKQELVDFILNKVSELSDDINITTPNNNTFDNTFNTDSTLGY